MTGIDGSGWWFVPVRHDGKELAPHRTRHGAVGQVGRAHANRPEWFTIERRAPLAYLFDAPRQTDSFDPHPGVAHD